MKSSTVDKESNNNEVKLRRLIPLKGSMSFSQMGTMAVIFLLQCEHRENYKFMSCDFMLIYDVLTTTERFFLSTFLVVS